MKKVIGVFPLLLAACLSGCGTAQAEPPAEIAQTLALLPCSVRVEPFQNISEVMDTGGWFSKDPNLRISVYQYENAQAAKTKLEAISENGTYITVGNTVYCPKWSQSPHFYLHGSQIIAYYGEDEALTEQLSEIFPQ